MKLEKNVGFDLINKTWKLRSRDFILTWSNIIILLGWVKVCFLLHLIFKFLVVEPFYHGVLFIVRHFHMLSMLIGAWLTCKRKEGLLRVMSDGMIEWLTDWMIEWLNGPLKEERNDWLSEWVTLRASSLFSLSLSHLIYYTYNILWYVLICDNNIVISFPTYFP